MRRQNDGYYTYQQQTRALMHHISPALPIGTVYEPTAGTGAISNVLKNEFDLTVTTNDIDVSMPTDRHFDATHPEAWLGARHDWVITNPPYNVAFEVLIRAYEHANIGVAMLLRLSFAEPTLKREKWLVDHQGLLSHLLIFGSPRPNYRKGEINPENGKRYGGDSVTTAWFVWLKGRILSPYTKVRFIPYWNVEFGEKQYIV